MILSRSEVAAVLLKAARGQGMPLGHADIFVAAAVRALADGTTADEVTTALRGPHQPVKFSAARVAMAGPVALDALACGENRIQLSTVDAPDIMQAMIENARENTNLRCICDVIGSSLVLRHGEGKELTKRTKGPIDIAPAAWAIWQDWAALTYVPASEASRESGAGAGLTDND